ncbi:MAG TPA: prephenate dehydrogenase/arogenate dehydrogenase family protein, partial [Candidatus Norongarragalinales archaeon]|nr:prephenate dehydrogenase/arogenate dehydrogenase family protein [Candidatus Norongarragalinales archaeon]
MKKLGLIGFGNFGRFAAEHLGEDFEILAYDPQMTQEINSNVKSVSLDEAASQPLVLLCVPLQNLPSVLEQIKPNVRPGALVVDTCSVKIKPSKAMEESIPEGVQIIGTHPLFGPQSGKNG